MIVIREATVKDIDKIILIESEWKNYYSCWGRDGFIKEFEKENSYTFVAEIEYEICGFINFWVIFNEIEINSLVVSKKFIRRGIASLLLSKVFEFSKKFNIKRLILEVNENNVAAIKLYEKYGFSIYNIRKKYYDFKYDAIMMERFL
ncbi:MAG: ribosomal protein S18-alanine N-acetyltransferase [Elusimicrobiales bacterium]|nr:ribosomal protein S18-alanine N-acetyltransferase [Elusimicrobiales bacterium]